MDNPEVMASPDTKVGGMALPAVREWTLWSDQRPPNAGGSYRYRATFPLLGLTVTAEWTAEMRLCGMGYGDNEWWPQHLHHWDGYRRYITHKGLEWSPLQASDPEGIVWHGIDLLPCPFTGRSPTIEPSGQFIGAPLWRTGAVWLSSPGVPKRRWIDAKKMQASWNTRVPAAPTPPPISPQPTPPAEGGVKP